MLTGHGNNIIASTAIINDGYYAAVMCRLCKQVKVIDLEDESRVPAVTLRDVLMNDIRITQVEDIA